MMLPHSWQLGASELFSNASLFACDTTGAANPIARGSADASADAGASPFALANAWNAAAMGPAAAAAAVSPPQPLNFVGVDGGPGSSREMTPALSLRSAVRNFEASQRK